MSEEPHIVTPDTSQLIGDPEKAHAMALAEDPYREEAAEAKSNAEHLAAQAAESPDPTISGNLDRPHFVANAHFAERSAAESESNAAEAGEEAGRQYDTEHNRIQDPEKAHAMALAGDFDRTEAAFARAEAIKNESQATTPENQVGPDSPIAQARSHEALAELNEEFAGREYDAQKALEAGPERIEDPEKAHAMADAGDHWRTTAAKERASATGNDTEDIHGRADAVASLNRALSDDVYADKLEEEAGTAHDLEHGLPVTQEQLQARERELFESIQEQTQGLKETVNELVELRKKYTPDGQPTAPPTFPPEAESPPSANP